MVFQTKIFHKLAYFLGVVVFLSSCVHTARVQLRPQTGKTLQGEMSSVFIADRGIKSVDSLVLFFSDEVAKDVSSVESHHNHRIQKAMRLADLYVSECAIEGINSDVAFVQMCLETGFLKFGGLVDESMNNFCGLGAISITERGNSFATEELGVRAHVQHLKAYASSDPLVLPLVDPRYKWVLPKGKSPTVMGLGGTWASDVQYGAKLVNLLERLSVY